MRRFTACCQNSICFLLSQQGIPMSDTYDCWKKARYIFLSENTTYAATEQDQQRDLTLCPQGLPKLRQTESSSQGLKPKSLIKYVQPKNHQIISQAYSSREVCSDFGKRIQNDIGVSDVKRFHISFCGAFTAVIFFRKKQCLRQDSLSCYINNVLI